MIGIGMDEAHDPRLTTAETMQIQHTYLISMVHAHYMRSAHVITLIMDYRCARNDYARIYMIQLDEAMQR